MKKRLLSLLAVGLLAVGMVGCSKDETPEPNPGEEGNTPATETKEVKVGVAIYQFTDNFMTLYRTELQNYFENELSNDEVKYVVDVQDGKNDQAEQTNQIQNWVTAGYDVIIANLVQATSAQNITDMCKEADIPVIYINREPEAAVLQSYPGKSTYVGADARQSGTFQGEIIANLPDKGDANGDGVVKYAMIQGDPENVDAQYRTEFSIKALTDAGIAVEELFIQRGDWDQVKGQELAANALTLHGDQLDVIFCNNDAMALGAVQAISAAGRTVNEDIYLVGVDALDEAVKLVNEGGMTGTVLNDHIGQSHKAADVAVEVVNGGSLEQIYTVDYQKVTK